ncbi:MAG: DNA-3-methyladenine glycosylase family protein [Coraliomargaritaceae bacterium]
MSFTPWQDWPDAPDLSAPMLSEILDGGQAFRWRRIEDFFEGRWGQHVVRLRPGKKTPIQLAFPHGVDHDLEIQALAQYLALEVDFQAMTDALPWRSDPVLKNAIQPFPGMRILRQPFAETLFCFLCSSAKQIPHIKAICENVANNLGSQLPDGSHALPDWETIAEAGESALRSARLGYRARYIHQCACFLSENPDWLHHTERLPTNEARKRLTTLPGVGPKIADCVLLFGAGRMDAFPVDTWIAKILSRAYGLDGWSMPQLQNFARVHFGEHSGFAQQYLFSAVRAGIIAQ